MEGYNIVVIGASAGGVEAISKLLTQLPAGLPAAVFIVQPISANSPGLLHQVLGRHASLPVTLARHDEPIRQGHVYVAPPDYHLLLSPGVVHVVRGPRENRTRPAIDPLFRSAAVTYGARVIGVLLTGMLDDGSAGLLAIRHCGGIVIVQDPQDAKYPDMPRNALEYLTADYRLPLLEIGKVLTQLIYQAA